MRRVVGVKGLIRVFAFVAAVSVGVTHPQTATLHVDKTVVSRATFGSNDTVAGAAACDSSGNLYLRVIDPSKHDRRPVLMFDKTGALQAKFRSPHASELEIPFALLASGGIAVADWNYREIRVVEFSSDGKVDSEVTLDYAAFIPYQLVVFPSGELLLSGIPDGNSGQPTPDKSITAIYDKNGHLIKRLILDVDNEIDHAIQLGDSRYARAPNEGNRAVTSGMAAIGEAGDVYLIRSTSPATAYVISSKGDVVRKVAVQSRNSADMPFEMQASKGKLAFVLDGWLGSRSSGNSTLAVVDATTGETLQDYARGVAGGGFFGLSCYTADAGTFTFVSMSKAKHVEITTATGK